MVKTKFTLLLALLIGALSFTGCSDDDDDNSPSKKSLINNGAITERESQYLVAASTVLRNDCLTLWASWEGGTGESDLIGELELELGTPYGTEYKNAGKAGSRYLTQKDAVEEMVQGILGIADELGKVKMGAAHGGKGEAKPSEAESRFSHNSLTDFKNNLMSIKNCYLGGFDENNRGTGLTVYVKEKNASVDTKTKEIINNAIKAIEACPEPFVNNLKDAKVETAMAEIAKIETVFADEVLPLVKAAGDYDFTTILKDFVDKTIIPTYKAMFDNSQLLLQKATAFQKTATKENLEAVGLAWKATRGPWENSEAFLFGPAGDKNLDPLLDSWPVDETQLSNVINSDQTLSADFVAEGLGYVTRGFHTVEYLIFRDGAVREVK